MNWRRAGVRISMDGKGRFLDNIFIERLWRSLKYEEVFTKAYGSVASRRAGALAAGCRSTTMSGRIRRWAIGRRVRCSPAKPVSMWITPAHRYALLRRYPHAHRHNIKKKRSINELTYVE